MSALHFVAEARHDLLQGVRWYNQSQSGLGLRFADAVQATLARAQAHPVAGKPASAGTRRMIVKGFPYSVYYRATATGLVVFAVAHHARAPDFWVTRAAHDE